MNDSPRCSKCSAIGAHFCAGPRTEDPPVFRKQTRGLPRKPPFVEPPFTETDDEAQARIENDADESVWDVAERCVHEVRARKETHLGVMEMAKRLCDLRGLAENLRRARMAGNPLEVGKWIDAILYMALDQS